MVADENVFPLGKQLAMSAILGTLLLRVQLPTDSRFWGLRFPSKFNYRVLCAWVTKDKFKISFFWRDGSIDGSIVLLAQSTTFGLVISGQMAFFSHLRIANCNINTGSFAD